MAGFDEMMTIGVQETTRRRIRFCAIKAAVDVMAEAADTEAHAERVVYAKALLSGAGALDNYCSAVMTNSTIAAEGTMDEPPLFGIPDADLEFTVNSLFNAMAGVSL